MLSLREFIFKPSLKFMLWTLGMVFSLASQGQTQITIERADALKFEKKQGQELQYLEGNVLFNHQGTLVYCDRAFFNQEKNEIDAQGKVRIVQGDSLDARGKNLIYNGNTKIAQLKGDVVLKDKSITLRSPSLEFNQIQQVAYFTQGGTITDGKNTLTSQRGSYHSPSQMFKFKDSVQVHNEEYTMVSDTLWYNSGNKTATFLGPSTITSDSLIINASKGWFNTQSNKALFLNRPEVSFSPNLLYADSILYNRNKGILNAFKNIELKDTSNFIWAYGDLAWVNQFDEKAYITQEPYAKFYVNPDTLFLRADTIFANNNPEEIKAFNKVKFFMKDIQGKCDSLAYDKPTGELRLFHQPFIWTQGYQLSSKKMRATLAEQRLDKWYLDEESFIVSPSNDSTYFNQISGKNMECSFKDNQLKEILVKGNGQAIYFPEESDGSIFGMNRSICSDLSIRFKNKQLSNIAFLTQPESVLYPLKNLNKKLMFLDGYHWKPELQPKSKSDIF